MCIRDRSDPTGIEVYADLSRESLAQRNRRGGTTTMTSRGFLTVSAQERGRSTSKRRIVGDIAMNDLMRGTGNCAGRSCGSAIRAEVVGRRFLEGRKDVFGWIAIPTTRGAILNSLHAVENQVVDGLLHH